MNGGPTQGEAPGDEPRLRRALVVYDRRFSEIARLAESVAKALAGDFDVHLSTC